MRLIGSVAILVSVLAFSAQASARERGDLLRGPRLEVGPEAQGTFGTGIGTRYGLAYGGRVGYRLDSGLYLGGAATNYIGKEAPSELLAGGEVGYDALLGRRWEIRPYAFVGSAIFHAGHPTESRAMTLAVEPGVVAAVHFGRAFISGEGRVQIRPDRGAASVLGGAGFTW